MLFGKVQLESCLALSFKGLDGKDRDRFRNDGFLRHMLQLSSEESVDKEEAEEEEDEMLLLSRLALLVGLRPKYLRCGGVATLFSAVNWDEGDM